MIAGNVTQVLPAGRLHQSLEGLTLVQVDTGSGAVTAADSLGAAPGERVVLSQGSAVQAALGTNCGADALVVCVLE